MRPPIRVLEVPVERGISDVEVAEGYVTAYAVFTVHGTAVSAAHVPIHGGSVRASELTSALLEDESSGLVEYLVASLLLDSGRAGPPAMEDVVVALRTRPQLHTGSLPSVTVAICTRDRAVDLRKALQSLEICNYENLEVLVIDNASISDDTRIVAEEFGARHVREPRKGLDWARNRAVLEGTGEIIAFLDDDAVASPSWLQGLGRAFAQDPSVAAVTGPVLPLELETTAQLVFEDWGGFNRGFTRTWFGRQHDTGAFGTGANMSFRAEVLQDIGSFDTALDVGTPTGGGGDLDILWRLVRSGHQVGYVPDAVVWHRHRRDMATLETQLVGYGGAVGAYLWKTAGNEESPWGIAAAGLQYGVSLLTDGLKAVVDPTRVPARIRLGALRRYVEGPRLYRAAIAQAQQEEQKSAQSEPAVPPAKDPVNVNPPAETRSISIDLAYPLEEILDLADVEWLYCIVSDSGALLGQVWIHNRGLSVPRVRVAYEIARQLGFAVVQPPEVEWAEFDRLARSQLMIESDGRTSIPGQARGRLQASVVLATLDRPESLQRALNSLTAHSSASNYEIIVVDNNPGSDLTPPIVGLFPTVKLVSERRRGLAYARNAGIRASNGEIVVCTDDDVVFPDHWIDRILEPFERRDVAAVCGRVIPAELETRAQHVFEQYGGLDRGEQSWVANQESFFRRYRVVPTWDLGATANAAFRREIFANPEIGPFDESLGPGTPTGVGEDTYVFYKILKAGFSIAYEAQAWVAHHHRETMPELQQQLAGYSRGQVSYQLTTLLNDGDVRALNQLAMNLPRYVARESIRSLRSGDRVPFTLRAVEAREFLRAPSALRKARRRRSMLGFTTAHDLRAEWAQVDVVDGVEE